MGTVHLLEALRQLKQPCAVVNVTSDKCYANREWVWGYRENEPMGGRDPYSNSKGCAELVTTAYRESFFLSGLPRTITASPSPALAPATRSAAAIGPAINSSPTSCRAFLAGQSCLIRNPSAIRPWQFVLEPLRGYLMLAERLSEDARASRPAGTSVLPKPTPSRCPGLPTNLVRSWGRPRLVESRCRDASARSPLPEVGRFKARAYLDWHPRSFELRP